MKQLTLIVWMTMASAACVAESHCDVPAEAAAAEDDVEESVALDEDDPCNGSDPDDIFPTSFPAAADHIGQYFRVEIEGATPPVGQP